MRVRRRTELHLRVQRWLQRYRRWNRHPRASSGRWGCGMSPRSLREPSWARRFSWRRVCPTRGPPPDAGTAPLGGGRPDRHRWRADLRRIGNDVSRAGRTIPVPQAGLRPPLGLSLRLDLVARDPGGSKRVSRRGVRRVSRRVRAVLLLDPHDRIDSSGTVDVDAEHRATCGSVRDRVVVDRELLRHEAGSECPGRADRHQTPVSWPA